MNGTISHKLQLGLFVACIVTDNFTFALVILACWYNFRGLEKRMLLGSRSRIVCTEIKFKSEYRANVRYSSLVICGGKSWPHRNVF
jgi:hypothetical protein